MTRKILAVILTAALIMVICGCSNVSPQPDNILSSETDDGSAVLHVLINAPSMHTLDSMGTKTYSIYDEVRRVAREYNKSHVDVSVEIESLPADSEERELRTRQLRAEILGGDGPDVYIMTDWPPIDQVTGINHFLTSIPADDTVFHDVAMSMRNGLFLDISQYYDADDGLDSEGLVSSIMDGGKIGDARYILPLRYTCPAVCAVGPALTSSEIDIDAMRASVGGFYGELLAKGNQTLAKNAARPGFPYPFFAFSDLFDYDKQNVTLSAEEVADYMRDFQSLVVLAQNTGSIGTPSALSEEDPLIFGSLEQVIGLVTGAESKGIKAEAFPLRSTDGELIAYVKTWGAVGVGCEHPQAAYDFLREFLSEESQWETERNGMMDFVDGCPVRPKAAGSEVVNELQWAHADEVRFTIKAEYEFEYSILQSTYAVTRSTSDSGGETRIYTASDLDIDVAAGDLINDLQYHIAEV